MKRLSVAEKDIERYLYKNPDALNVDCWIERQLRLPSGVADLIGIRGFSIVVVEIKAVEITAEVLTQVCRYATDIERIFENIDIGHGVKNIQRVVVSPFSVGKKIMFEANALNVDIHTFDTEISIKVSDRWHWTDDFGDKYQDKIKKLSQSETLRNAVMEIEIAVDKELDNAKQDS